MLERDTQRRAAALTSWGCAQVDTDQIQLLLARTAFDGARIDAMIQRPPGTGAYIHGVGWVWTIRPRIVDRLTIMPGGMV